MSLGRSGVLAAAGGIVLASSGAAQKLVGPEMWYSWNGGSVGRPGIVRDIKELLILGMVILLRAVLAILIHWEIKNERRDEKEKVEDKSHP